jgi:DNA-binding GntR family transcriptional regulator
MDDGGQDIDCPISQSLQHPMSALRKAMVAPPDDAQNPDRPPRRRARAKPPAWMTNVQTAAADYAERRHLTMSAGLYDVLHDAITSGAIPEGADLRERDIADLHNVSRTPTREALRRLLAEQLLVRKGKGLVVATRSLTDVRDGISLRGAILPLIVTLAIERAKPEDIEELAAQTAALRMAADAGDLARTSELTKAYDRTLFGMAHSPLVSRALFVQIGPAGLMERMLALPGRALRATEDREHILAAIHNRDESAALAAVRRHIERASADLLSEIVRLHEQS